MRTAAACLVLAAAIATPGIVIGATRTSSDEQTETFMRSSITPGPVGAPINPRLRPTVRAVTRALAQRGIRLTVVPSGAHTAQGIELGSHGRCGGFVSFGRRLPRISAPCGSGNIDSSAGPIGYSPASLGPTIAQALATLPAAVGASAYVPNSPLLTQGAAAITRALKARGEKDLQTIWSVDEAEILQAGGPGRPCQVHVQVTIVKPVTIEMWITSPACSDNTVRRGKLRVRYSPLSLGIAIRKALATLSR